MKQFAIVLLSIVIILLCAVEGAVADSNNDKKELNEAETAGFAFSMFVGEGLVVPVEKMHEYDEINSRYIFLYDADLGCDLAIMIRVSETDMWLWQMELSTENLIKAKLIFDKEAPFCYLALFQDGDAVDSAIYLQSLAELFPYDQFESNVDRIINSLSPGEVTGKSGEEDPLLSRFPGIEWNMTKDQIFGLYGKELFTDVDIALSAKLAVDDHSVTYTFMLGDGKLNQIVVFIPEDKTDYYFEIYKGLYGIPIKTSFGSAAIGIPVESKDGDTYVWEMESSIVYMHGTGMYYNPIY